VVCDGVDTPDVADAVEAIIEDVVEEDGEDVDVVMTAGSRPSRTLYDCCDVCPNRGTFEDLPG